MDWFVSVREEESGAHLYRGGAAPDPGDGPRAGSACGSGDRLTVRTVR